ncbi:IS4 family transposase [Candidatus Competibacter phosphatis]|uniref:IS4 family transposase n=1 Tax=Candidatus Competibacter phosphatis TaxID=221280 RepID=UPI0028ACB4D2|nr:IS4 family transposase [Candidatus Competibacter phosphatis]
MAWRLHYLTVLGRAIPELPGDAVLDPAEWRAVYVAIHRKSPPETPPALPILLAWIARLGGHLGRKCDGPPGPQALWIGLQRARDLAWGDAVGFRAPCSLSRIEICVMDRCRGGRAMSIKQMSKRCTSPAI